MDGFGWPRWTVETMRPLDPNDRGGFSQCPRSSSKGSSRIVRAEPQGLKNVIVRFFSVTNVNFTQPDKSMGLGKISIQRQRVLTFGDALRGSLGHYVDIP